MATAASPRGCFLNPDRKRSESTLFLAEPVSDHPKAALDHLKPMVKSVTVLPVDLSGKPGVAFDLILANHGLYYVPDPCEILHRLL